MICYITNPIFKFLNINPLLAKSLISGILELTNGINTLSLIHDKLISHQIIMCAILLGFGSFSVLLQVLSITSKSDLSIKTYIYGKFSQGIIAGFYTFLAIKFIPIFNLDLETSYTLSHTIQEKSCGFKSSNFFILIFLCILFFYLIKKIFHTYSKLKINIIN